MSVNDSGKRGRGRPPKIRAEVRERYQRQSVGYGSDFRSNDGIEQADQREVVSPGDGTFIDPLKPAGSQPENFGTINQAGNVDSSSRREAGREERRDNGDQSAGAGSEGRKERRAKTDQGTVAREIPFRIVSGKKKKTTAKEDKATTVGLLAVSCNALYALAALGLGSHWFLSGEESMALAQSLDTALETLPANSYKSIRNYIDKYAVWVALAITATSITAPRVNESIRQYNVLAFKRKAKDGSAPAPDSGAETRSATQDNVGAAGGHDAEQSFGLAA